jgi:hypothetical protein
MSGFGLSCSLKRWREWSVVHNLYLMVCTQLWTQLYRRVGTQSLLLGHASSCRHPLNGTKTINYLFIYPWQDVADAFMGMAILMQLSSDTIQHVWLSLPYLYSMTLLQPAVQNSLSRIPLPRPMRVTLAALLDRLHGTHIHGKNCSAFYFFPVSNETHKTKTTAASRRSCCTHINF